MCALAASFPGSSTLHPLCRGFEAKSIKTANTAPLPAPPPHVDASFGAGRGDEYHNEGEQDTIRLKRKKKRKANGRGRGARGVTKEMRAALRIEHK